MLKPRKSDARGRTKLDWLDSKHTFSFGHYYDPNHTGFRDLVVINQDVVKPNSGFDTHPHRNMEIISYILRGEIRHRDSMGNDVIIPAGEVQTMTAGTGIRHSEHNPSNDNSLELLQIWVRPNKQGLAPAYSQIKVSSEEMKNRLKIIASSDQREGSTKIHQDVSVFSSRLEAGQHLPYTLPAFRYAWIQLISGELDINGEKLGPGDGVAIADEVALRISAFKESEFLLFDLC